MEELAKRLVDALPETARPLAQADGELAAALARAVRACHEAHPDLALLSADFAAYLGARLDGDRAPSVEIESREVADLYLAFGCFVGDAVALAQFESTIAPALLAAISRVAGASELAADVLLALREKIFVGSAGQDPRIGDYAGRGKLVTWLRVIAVRAAVSELRKTRRLVPDDEQLWEAASPSADPELALIKHQAAADIKEAFAHGLAKLTPRQRNLLRQHLLDGLSIDQLGAIYRIHRVTAARWLTKARSDLWNHTRRRLRQRLGLTAQEIGSLLDEVRSTLDLSIERVLR